MAKPAPKSKFNLKLPLLLIGVGAIAYLMVGGDDAKPTGKKPPRKSSSKDDKTKDLYTKQDRETFFKPAKYEIKDAFHPLVSKAVSMKLNTAPTGLNPMLMDGETWVFSGTPEVDGKRQALIENTTTGEAKWLSEGEGFKQMHVKRITPETLTIVGNDGSEATINLADAAAGPTKAVATGAVAPVTPPPLRGQIGSGLPNNAAADISNQDADPANMMAPPDTGNQRQRGRRRNSN